MIFPTAASEFVYVRTYSKWIELLSRRESYPETVDRFIEFLTTERPNIPPKVIRKIKKYMLEFGVMPSMRFLWAAGEAARQDNTTIYNCSFQHVTEIESFAETLYILMCGTGAGFGVSQKNHYNVNLLPTVPSKIDKISIVPILVFDHKAGWADSVKMQIGALYMGNDIELDYSQLRRKGARLKTMGGRSSGPEPLIKLHAFIREVFYNARGRKLTSLECHDIETEIAEIVVVGGVRRSSEISISDLDDEKMRDSKTGNYPLRRAMANNSAIYLKKPSAVEFLKEWAALAASGSGERGIFNLEAARKRAPKRRNGDLIEGTNPSLRAGTKVWTKEYGMVPIEQLENKTFKIKNLDGNLSDAKCWLSSPNERLVKITLEGGYAYYSTLKHKWPVIINNVVNRIETSQLESGMELPRYKYQEVITYGKLGTYEDGKLIGYFYGDGWVTVRSDNGKTQYGVCVPKNRPNKMLYLDKFKELFNGEGAHHKGGTIEFNSSSKKTNEYFNKFGVKHKSKGLPEKIWSECSNDFINGFIEGFSDADGHKGGESDSRFSICSSKEKLIDEFQELLGFKGIYLNKTKNVSESYRNSHKTYNKKTTRYTLRRKWKIATSGKNVKILSVELTDLIEPVWDISVNDEHHCFQLAGVITGNCGEIMLRHKQFCNLSEVVLRPEDDVDTLLDKVECATWLGIIQATFTYFPYLSPEWKANCEEERLLGVSITGQMDNPELLTASVLQAAKKKALKVAKMASDHMNINMPAAVTCVKPSGTVSQLVASASGLHTWVYKWFIRYYRISATDPLFKMMQAQSVPMVPEVGQTTSNANTWVVGFPMKAPDGAIVADDVNAIEQLEHYKKVQTNWCEHNASATIYVKDHEWFEVGNWVYQNWEFINGVSFLPYDGGKYELAPYTQITQEQYNKMLAIFPKIDYSKLSEFEMEDGTTGASTVACSGGVCELN